MARYTATPMTPGAAQRLEVDAEFSAVETSLDLALLNQGAYSASAIYDKNDVVSNAGQQWQSLQDDNVGHTPAAGAWWTVFGGGNSGPVGWDEVENKPAEFPPAVHTHTLADITDAGTAAALSVPTAGNAAVGEVVKGDDTRLSNSRTPTAHKTTHATGGNDAIAPADIGAATAADLTSHTGASAPHAGHLKADGSVALTGNQGAGGYRIVNAADPVDPQDLATKSYTDAIGAGLKPKADVKAAAPANVTLSSPGTATFDTVAFGIGESLALLNQTTQSENGVYIFNGSASALTRRSDLDTSGEMLTGISFKVLFGATYGGQQFVLVTPAPVTLDTTALTFAQFGGRGVGEANTASNVGDGGGAIFKVKSGLDLVFRTVKAISNRVSVAVNGDVIEVDVVEANLNHNNIGGTLGPTKGGTGLTAAALGDFLYASAANAWARLTGNNTTTRKFLRQTGDGTVSAAPVWDTLTPDDLPVFRPSGATHAAGAVPDPGAVPGLLRFLREDGGWATTGTRWYSGSAAPSSALGSEGDYYWRTTNGDVSKKTSGVWSVVGNIKGPTGPPGGVTVEQVAGRGANMIANGAGDFGNNYNFSPFTYDPLEVRSSAGSFKITSAGTSGNSGITDEFVPVDAERFYRMQAWARTTNLVADNNFGHIGIAPFDSDKLLVAPQHYTRTANTDTTLAAPLAPGDGALQLTSAANWKNSAGDLAYQRQVTLWGYRNASGYIYPAYTYSRLTSSNYNAYAGSNPDDQTVGGAWDGGGIAGNTITLRAAWPASLGNPVNKTGNAEPTWPTGAGETVYDGSVKWTEAGALQGGEAVWAAGATYALNSYVAPSAANGHRYQATLINVWPAGTPVSNATGGSTYRYVAAVNVAFPTTWTQYSGIIGGIETGGGNSADKFPPGTSFVKALFLANRDNDGRNGTAGNATAFADISLMPALFAADVVDFTEAMQDAIGSFFVAGAGIQFTYNDASNTFTVVNTQPLTAEQVQDIVGAMTLAGANVTATYDDTAGTLTLASAGSSTLTTEDVQDIVAGLLQQGSNVTLTYDDTLNTLTVTAAGGGGATPTGTGWRHVTSGVEDAAASTPTKSDVGLGNVDNTADTDKPVSTAQAAAIALKADVSHTHAETVITFTDVTTNNVTTVKHGFAPKLPNDATKYLDGTGAYSVPPVNGSLVIAGTKGYALGGFGAVVVVTADKLTFATDTTTAQSSANLSAARSGAARCSDGSTKGYVAGGYNGSTGVVTADKLIFSTDTTAAVSGANLSTARYGVAGVSDRSTKGYAAGGYTTVGVVTTDKITFSSDTTAAQSSANLSTARYYVSGLPAGTTKGYLLGGSASAVSDRLVYATDTTAAQSSANLSTARASGASFGDGSTKGYVCGGDQSGSYVATADKITFSTDTTSAQSSANLSSGRGYVGGMSQGSSLGYSMGGYTGSVSAVTDRLVFPTDTNAAQSSANLSAARSAPACLSDVAC